MPSGEAYHMTLSLPNIFRREPLIASVLEQIERGEYVAIWGPRYSGRTTVIEQLRHELGKREEYLAVYTVPADNLDPSSRGRLFYSLAQHIQNEHARLTADAISNELLQATTWDHPDA